MAIITREAPARLKIPRKQVTPRKDEVRFRCGKCGCMRFEIHVRPVLGKSGVTGRAKAAAAVCVQCLKVFRIDEMAFVEGDGSITVREKDGRYVAPIPHTGSGEGIR